MFFIPGIVITLLTFPGVIVHELAHQFFCWVMKIPVLEVKYFQFKNPCGYVIHESTDKPFANFVISAGPFIVNTIFGIIILFPVAIELMEFEHYNNIFNIITAWFGISILMHSFPSTGDAQVMVNNILKNKEVNIFAKILTAPIVIIIYLGAIGSMFWLDLGYAMLVGALLPRLILPFII